MRCSGTYAVGDSVFDVEGEYSPAIPPKFEAPEHAGAPAEFAPETVLLGEHDFTKAAHRLWVEILPAEWVEKEVRNLAMRMAKLAAAGQLTDEIVTKALATAVDYERTRWVPLIDAMASEIAGIETYLKPHLRK